MKIVVKFRFGYGDEKKDVGSLLLRQKLSEKRANGFADVAQGFVRGAGAGIRVAGQAPNGEAVGDGP